MNSIKPGELWPDNNGVHINAHGGGILEHKGTYFWFGEHKVEGEAGNKAQVGVHAYSSTDLYTWTDRGIALVVKDNSDIEPGCIIERPKVLFCAATGKFVMWFHLELKGMDYASARVGIATADQPTGPYEFVRSMRLDAGKWPVNAREEDRRELTASESADLAGKAAEMKGGPFEGYPKNLLFRRDFHTGQMSRDMTLFLDDDGKAYLICASEENGTLHIHTLTDDFLGTTGEWSRHFPGRFHEAPAMFKAAGKYWLFTSDCTGWNPNPARLSSAESIHGPWSELGNPCHGSDAEKKTTFESQPTFVLPVIGKGYIFMADRWCPHNAIDGRYIWLPIMWEGGEGEQKPYLEWYGEWDLDVFD